MNKRLQKPHAQLGFSLIEMAVVLAILALMTGGGLALLTSSQEQDRFDETVRKIERIESAILNFYIKHGHLPCAASGTAAESDATFGVTQTCNPADSPAGVTQINDGIGREVWFGVVPTKTLNLPNEYMLDGWDHRISYAVIPALGGDAASYSGAQNTTDTNGYISITDESGNPINTFTDTDSITAGNQFDNVAYAIISHGGDSNGGWRRSGAASGCGTTAADTENCDADALLIDRRINNSPSDSTATYFYDVIRWKTKSQLEFDAATSIGTTTGGFSLTTLNINPVTSSTCNSDGSNTVYTTTATCPSNEQVISCFGTPGDTDEFDEAARITMNNTTIPHSCSIDVVKPQCDNNPPLEVVGGIGATNVTAICFGL